jgi:hypothetical protein
VSTKVHQQIVARQRSTGASPGQPDPWAAFRAGLRADLRAELVDLADKGLLGNAQVVPRVAGNPEEWGSAWGMSGQKVRELVRRGLPHVRIGAQTRIMFASPEVLAWLREHGDYLAESEAAQ